VNLNDLATFVLVVEAGTFSGAAERLGVPKSTISRRVARLEEELGLALLKRATRSFDISDDGRALYERCAPALRDIADVERDIADSEGTPRGRIRLSTSIDFGTTTYLAELLSDYAARFPEVGVDLQLTNRVVDLLEENIDLSFRTHSRPLPSRDDLVARKLGQVDIGVYASPTYLAQAGWPRHIDELAGHRTLSHGKAYLAGWATEPQLTADDYRPVAAMMAAGAGVGLLPDFVAGPFLAQERLVRVLPTWKVPPATLSLVWLRSRHLAPRVRAFIDLAARRARERGIQ